MAENNKLYITISNERGTGKGSVPTPKPNNNDSAKNQEEDNLLGRYAEHELFHLVKNTTTQSVNFAISNIGNFTGDYITQRKVNAMKSAMSGVMNIGMTTLAGAKYGPLGSLVGFVVGAGSMVAGSVFDEIMNRNDNARANFNISMLRERVGLNAIYDGSRGTEN